jgi:hypothetical protein
MNESLGDLILILIETAKSKWPNIGEDIGNEADKKRDPICLVPDVRTRGRVVHLRRISKRLVFLDLQTDGPNPTRLECICKYPDLDEDSISALRSKIGLGDWIEVSGWIELVCHDCGPEAKQSDRAMLDFVFHLKDASVIEGWDHLSNGAFIPLPPATRTAAAPPANPPPTPSTDQLCKFFVNTGRCPTPEGQCKYVHDRRRAEAWKAERNAQRAQRFTAIQAADAAAAANDDDDPAAAAAAAGEHPAASLEKKAHRAAVFADWLLAEFGHAALSRGTGVLDVAGGRGEVSWALRLRGVPATLLDPRPMKLSRLQARHLRALRAAAAAGAPLSPAERGLLAPGASLPAEAQVVARLDADLLADPARAGLLGGLSAVVAMHPDQVRETGGGGREGEGRSPKRAAKRAAGGRRRAPRRTR